MIMTRERISKLNLKDLIKLSEIFLVDIKSIIPESETINGHMRPDLRLKLEEQVFEVLEEVRLEQKQSDSLSVRFHQKHFIGIDEFFGYKLNDGDSSFSFPEQYNVTRIMLMLRNPEWAFTYWDISNVDRAATLHRTDFEHFSIVLKGKSMANTAPDEEPIEMDIPIQISDSSWYINLPKGNNMYSVELVAHYHQDPEAPPDEEAPTRILARSGIIRVPMNAGNDWEDLSAKEVDAHVFNPRKLT